MRCSQILPPPSSASSETRLPVPRLAEPQPDRASAHIRYLAEHTRSPLLPTLIRGRVSSNPPRNSSSRIPIPSSNSPCQAIPSSINVNTERADIPLVPQFERQTGAGRQWGPDTIRQPDSHPAMTTPGTEPTPVGPGPGTNRRNSLSPPPSLTQTSSRATSPVQGSTGSSLTVVHGLLDKLRPTATIRRYERSVKLEGPYIDVNLPPLTTSFDG